MKRVNASSSSSSSSLSLNECINTSKNVELIKSQAAQRMAFFTALLLRQILTSGYLLFLMASLVDLPRDVLGFILQISLALRISIFFPQGFYQPMFYTMEEGILIVLMDGVALTTQGNPEITFNDIDFDGGLTQHLSHEPLPYILSITTGYKYYIIHTIDGLFSSGWNNHGQLCLGNFKHNSRMMGYHLIRPITSLPSSPIIKVACGESHTMVLTLDNCLYGCGYNEYGQLGLGHNKNQCSLMTKRAATKVISVSCGDLFTMIVKENGSLYACGQHGHGALGIGRFLSRYGADIDIDALPLSQINSFVKIQLDCFSTPLPPFKFVVCGSFSTIAYSSPNCLYSFGESLDTNCLCVDVEIAVDEIKRPIRVATKRIGNVTYFHTSRNLSDCM